ncbi:MAG: hypothetical protein M3160_09180 [Candidatus Eremiobacteraeota bacterium]|nr:hypothetical protein [Candidatus Eremiobacteraeota bacterium]
MSTTYVRHTAVAALILSSLLSSPAYADSSTSPSPSPAIHEVKIDPCAMLAAPNLASALGVAVQTIGTPQRPSANQCLWAVAAHGSATPAQTVLLVLDANEMKKSPCRGLSCLGLARSIVGMIPGVNIPAPMEAAFADAQLISGLGDKAAWKNGWLTVVKDQVAFQLLVQAPAASQSQLEVSQILAQNVLTRLSTRK